MTLTFHQALEQAEAQARSTLDVALHDRLTAARTLVTQGRVFQDDRGHWTVTSAKHPGMRYTVNGSCQCSDLAYNRPQYCKHQLGVFLARRCTELLREPAEPAEPVVLPEEMEVFPDNDPGELPMEQPAPQPAPQPLPEAPCSANVHVTIAGRDVLLTLRDHDEGQLLARLHTLLAGYPVPEPPSQTASQGKGVCPVHNVTMKLNDKNGRQWFSHKTDQGWCQGRRR